MDGNIQRAIEEVTGGIMSLMRAYAETEQPGADVDRSDAQILGYEHKIKKLRNIREQLEELL